MTLATIGGIWQVDKSKPHLSFGFFSFCFHSSFGIWKLVWFLIKLCGLALVWFIASEMCGFARWIHRRLVENPIWYYDRFRLLQLLWCKFITKSSSLFCWVVSISDLYSKHMLIVSYCSLRLFTRILVCVLDVGLMRLDERPFSFPILVNFLSLAFMCRIIPLFDWYSFFLLVLLRLIIDWVIGWLWTCFGDASDLMTLFIIKIDQYIAVIIWFW